MYRNDNSEHFVGNYVSTLISHHKKNISLIMNSINVEIFFLSVPIPSNVIEGLYRNRMGYGKLGTQIGTKDSPVPCDVKKS